MNNISTNIPIFSLGENKLTTNYKSILNLGEQPWGNDFLTTPDNSNQKKYPLHLVYCYDTELLQLTYFVPKETMFLEHTYVTTPSLLEDFLSIAKENTTQYNLQDGDIVLDIGGNDGSQLLQYKKLGINSVINFESAKNIAKLSEQNGVKCINDFFNLENVKKHLQPESVKLINASGIFFHLEELHSVIEGINYCLRVDGVFIVQFMYAGTMIEKLNFDTIYHEHLCYYTVKSLRKLLLKYGIFLEDGYYTELHSGSVVAKFRKYNTTMSERAQKLIKSDEKYNLEAFIDFGRKVTLRKNNLKNLLIDLKNKGKRIYAYGAPVKGSTLMNYMGIDNTLIDKAVEMNPLKIGRFTPGGNIPVVQESESDLPDYYLLLAHNFADKIISKNRHLLDKGVRFILPFPEVEIIESI